jgi:hypothetical protein
MGDISRDQELLECCSQVAKNALLDFKYEYLGRETGRFLNKAIKKEKYRKLSAKYKLYYRNITMDLKRLLECMIKWMDGIDTVLGPSPDNAKTLKL